MAELRNLAATRWDWDRILREQVGPEYFPRGITHADLDNETEINGHFLVTEGKRTGETLSNGQRYAMDARVRDGRVCIVIYGDPETDRIDSIQLWPHPPVSGTWQDYWSACREFAYWADHQPPPVSRPSSFAPRFTKSEAA